MTLLKWPRRVKRYSYKRVVLLILSVSVVTKVVWFDVYQDSSTQVFNWEPGTEPCLSDTTNDTNNNNPGTSSIECLFLKYIPFSRHIHTLCRKSNDVQMRPTKRKRVCKDPFLSTFLKEQNFICFAVDGRLGNQMFLFASAYGIAQHTGRRLVIDKTSPLLKIFKVDQTVMAERCVCDDVKVKCSKKHCSFDETLFTIPNDGNYQVRRYLQSWRYFQNVTGEVRDQFTFKRHIVLTSLSVLRRLREEYKSRTADSASEEDSRNVTFVGVHVRETDRGESYTRLGYRVAPKEYIHNAMNYFENKFTDVIFVVFSNVRERAKKHVRKRKNVFFVDGYLPEVDMCILAHCNHTIMTVGTFGWFASFLAGGVTVYYKHPYKENSSVRKQYSADYRDYFYPGWIAME
ncbi:galactoside alpha-(1,2)-fucosyltransferase 2-like isoform X2 [Gigantopelta aegis]|uniref:galactoside alpha-(1,2)-fucosyltransferase 2-like isoform X2 n=1 Tax=Gigantopelta aegis TaxID=1735272 RepID=UPI001B88CB30|nr:galactoside alpha-(1,2)-fucosyltransferase 2-like isoform X2 [Gigantopelta aegis]